MPADKRAPRFAPLSYFPSTPSYRIPAVLQLTPQGRSDARDADVDRASAGKMRRVGTLAFTLKASR